MGFLLGVILLGVAWWLLFRLKQRDLAQCQQLLVLTPAANAPVAQGTTPEGFAFVERVVLHGTMQGLPATLAQRTVKSPMAPRLNRKGSELTVLSLALARPARVSLRIQPAGMLGGIETLVRGAAAHQVPIDATFDKAYTVYSETPAAALTVLTPVMRERLLAFRTQVAGNLPDSAAGKMASGLLLGTFHVDGLVARYSAFGSPTRATAEQIKAAASVLHELIAATIS